MINFLGIRANKHRYAFKDRLELSMFQPRGNEQYVVATNIEWTVVDLNSSMAPCLDPLEMDAKAAQVLMDDLWACGIRPTEGSGSAGAFEAQRRHLEDMRALVFKTKSQ